MSVSDEQLVEMATVFDNFVLQFCEEFGMSPLATSGLVLARLAKLSHEMGYSEQYKKLMNDVFIINETSSNIISNNSTSLH